jgi:hypothetical protein
MGEFYEPNKRRIMQELREKILKEGKICPNDIVKVDSF